MPAPPLPPPPPLCWLLPETLILHSKSVKTCKNHRCPSMTHQQTSETFVIFLTSIPPNGKKWEHESKQVQKFRSRNL